MPDPNPDLMARVPPHSVEAEQVVLASLLVDNTLVDFVSDLVSPASFYHPQHELLFDAILRLHGKGEPVNTVSLREALGSRYEEAGGFGYLVDLMDSIPTTAHVEYHAQLVAEKAKLRALRAIGTTLAGSVHEDGADSEAIQNQALASLGRLQMDRTDDVVSGPDLLNRYILALEGRAERTRKGATIKFPWVDVNQALELSPGNLVLLAARPAVGKTNWALSVAAHVAKTRPVLFLSLEMSWDQLADRLYMAPAQVDGRTLKSGMLDESQWKRVMTFGESMEHSKLVIESPASLTIAGLRRRALKLAAQGQKPALVVVDYLQLMETPNADRHDLAIGQISRGLKMLGAELGCVVLALSQLSREVRNRTNKRPLLTDLRDSGSLEQDADVVVFLHREDYYAEQEGRRAERPGVCEVIIAKYRSGAAGTVELYFDRHKQRFENLAWGDAS